MSLVDVSEVAVEELRDEATRLGLALDLFVGDPAEYDLGPAQYDLIVLFYYLDRSLFPRIVSALSPGGLFICEMAMRWPAEGASNAAGGALHSHEIISLVPGLEVVDHQERPVHHRGVLEFVGRKPEE